MCYLYNMSPALFRPLLQETSSSCCLHFCTSSTCFIFADVSHCLRNNYSGNQPNSYQLILLICSFSGGHVWLFFLVRQGSCLPEGQGLLRTLALLLDTPFLYHHIHSARASYMVGREQHMPLFLENTVSCRIFHRLLTGSTHLKNRYAFIRTQTEV